MSRASSGAAETLLGRADEVAALSDALSRVAGGHAAAVEIVGEPGIGKSRLLAELAARADAGGALVLQGAASELESDLPFAVFVNALDEFVHGLPASTVETLGPQALAELAGLLPSLSSYADPAAVGLQHERYRSHRAVADLLELVAARQPVVLVLDDLHWVDWASAELVTALLGRPPSAGVLISIARRPRQTVPRLASALDRAHRSGHLVRLQPAPLSPSDARLLLGAQVIGSHADALCAECGGNPFYLEELARSTRRDARAVPARVGDAVTTTVLVAGVTVPAAVAASMDEELRLLAPESRRLLEGAAVAGDPFELALATTAADVDDAVAVEALDDLLRLDVVRTTDVPTRFTFRHPIVRRAVYESVGAARRLVAHERCARALSVVGAPATTLAGHVERSGRQGDLDAVAVLREAGDQASLRAPASAARWYGAAAEMLPADAPAGARIALLLPRAAALAAVGEYQLSFECLQHCLDIVSRDDIALRTQLTASCAGLEHLLGRHADAHARLLRALDALPDRDSVESVSFLATLAMGSYFVTRYDEMADRARRALVGARRVGDVGLEAISGALLSLAGALAGAEEARGDCSETAALIDAAPDDLLISGLEAVGHLAFAELNLERFDAAVLHADRVVRIARSTGQGPMLALVVPIQVAVQLVRGNLTEALRLIDDAVDATRLTGNDRAIVWVVVNRSAVRLVSGDVAGALADAQECAERLTTLDEPVQKGLTGVRLAEAQLARGEPESALAALDELGGGRDLVNVQSGERVAAFELRTRCLLAVGRNDEAAQAAQQASARAGQLGLVLASTYADRAVAAVHLASGRPTDAAEAGLRAAANAGAMGAPILAAVSRTLAGEALAAAGSTELAVRELDDAATTLHVCGAVLLRGAAEQALRRCGRPVHRRSAPASERRTGLDALTSRERQIADLVSRGLTNAAIAKELFLSLKTIETHVRHIFAKLDVSSRAQIAREVSRAEAQARN
ncbi:MAG TPA: AAA family ATPase [Nocardioidaceae bacterium]|nr:AAA family ATPase [Nocardioidaceae bacterium]